MNGTGFPLAKLRDAGIYPEFFHTDKDFSQINAARFTWEGVKIQLCKWHIKKAIKTRLASNKSTRNSQYNHLSEFGSRFPFNEDDQQQSRNFCPKELRPTVWQIMEKHLHQHPLIPTNSGQFLTSATIREEAIKDMYEFCKKHSLISLWQYLWCE